MKIGLLAYSTDTGLGRQTYDFYKYMDPAKTLVVDLSAINKLPTHHDRYPGARIAKGIPTQEDCNWLLDGVDLVFMAETPLNYYLIQEANRRKIPTVLQPNFEFTDYFLQRGLPQPTVFALPTTWNIQQFKPQYFKRVAHLPVPVDTAVLPPRSIKRANIFFHIAGRPAIHDRNGTLAFIKAAQLCYVDAPKAQFVIYCQQPTREIVEALRGTKIELIESVPNHGQLYTRGEVLVLPRRFGGLCLPAQEAVGSHIPVLMPNISPNNDWLPQRWLVPVAPTTNVFRPRGLPIKVYDVDIVQLAAHMIVLHHDAGTVVEFHEQAKKMARVMSWEAMQVKYQEFLERLVAHVH